MPWARLHAGLSRWRAAAGGGTAGSGTAGLADAVEAMLALGLRAAALDHAALLEPAEPALARGLSERARDLPDDTIDPALMRERVRRGVAALRGKGLDLEPSVATWAARLEQVSLHRASDGNIARRRGGPRPAWSRLTDERAAAYAVRLELADPGDPIGRDAKPVILEGLDPPWLFERVLGATGPSQAGYQPWVVLVQADPLQLLDGLAQSDLDQLLSQERVTVLCGPGSSERLGALLRSRLESVIVGTVLRLPTTASRIAPTLEQVVTLAAREQESELSRLVERNEKEYRTRDGAWWAARFERASQGRGPLRVLIPTTRYSTFVRHSAQDLAACLRGVGCEALVLEERDGFSRMSALAYARAVGEFSPDLVVLINHDRSALGAVMPAGLPLIVWAQDRLMGMFEGPAGERDMAVGAVPEEAARRRGYGGRVLSRPVPAWEGKFHAGPVAPSLHARHACEVACVSHQSQTPEAFHRRALAAAGDDPVSHRALESLYVRVSDAVLDMMHANLQERLSVAADTALRLATGREPEPDRVASLVVGYAMPLADRLLRHTTLAWAADLASRRGWRFHLYGRGWDEHPTLARFARGALEHGEELRAGYAAASAHLHVSAHAMMHQRVVECALSGGLPVTRLLLGDLQLAGAAAARAALQREGWRAGPFPVLAIADHPELMLLARLRQVRGLPAQPTVDPNAWPQWLRALLLDHAPIDTARLALRVLGDASETCFWDRPSLEAALTRAVERPAWRADVSAGIARRAADACTMGAFVRELLDWARERLTSPATIALRACGGGGERSEPGEVCASDDGHGQQPHLPRLRCAQAPPPEARRGMEDRPAASSAGAGGDGKAA